MWVAFESKSFKLVQILVWYVFYRYVCSNWSITHDKWFRYVNYYYFDYKYEEIIFIWTPWGLWWASQTYKGKIHVVIPCDVDQRPCQRILGWLQFETIILRGWVDQRELSFEHLVLTKEHLLHFVKLNRSVSHIYSNVVENINIFGSQSHDMGLHLRSIPLLPFL